MKEKDNFYISCPSCGKNNLSISRFTGLWHCYSAECGKKGNFKQLCDALELQDVPDISFRPPEKADDKTLSIDEVEAYQRYKTNVAEIIEWAVSRSLDPDVCMKAGVGFNTQQDCVVYGYQDEKGKLIGFKSKAVTERLYKGEMIKPQWLTGREPLLYVPDLQDLKKEKLILVEGEVDALTLKSMNLPAVASLGAAKEKGFGLLSGTRRIFVGYDMDIGGQAGSQVAAEKLGLYKCRHVTWGAKDVNDWVVAGATKEMVVEALQKATKYAESQASFSAWESLNEYYDAHEAGVKPRRSWGWPELDRLSKGWGGGELIGVQAESNTGKTTWMLNVASNVAGSGIPVGIVSLEEHPVNEITPKLFSCMLGKNIQKYNLKRSEAQAIKENLDKVHIYRKSNELKDILDFIRDCYYNHDCEMVLVDYFQLAVKDEESVQCVKDSIWAFKSLTLECPNLTIVLFIQPKQLPPETTTANGKKVKKPKLSGATVRGGSSINQTVSKMLNISPVNRHPNVTQFEYTKIRGHLDVSKKDWMNIPMQMEYDHDTMRMTARKGLILDLE